MEKVRKPRDKHKEKVKDDKQKNKPKVSSVTDVCETVENIPSSSSVDLLGEHRLNNEESLQPYEQEIESAVLNEAGDINVEPETISVTEDDSKASETVQLSKQNLVCESAVEIADEQVADDKVEEKDGLTTSGQTAMYLTLQNELLNLEITQEMIPEYIASAPLMVESDSASTAVEEASDELNPAVHRTKEVVLHRKIGSRIAVVEGDQYVRPFTESQLKALYCNFELESNDMYVQHFIENHRCFDSHEFYELVAGYQRCRMQLLTTIKLFEELKQKYNFKVEHVWSSVNHVAKAQAKCRDGNSVVGSYEYRKAVYSSENAEELKSLLSTIQTTANEVYALHAYEVELSKLQVDSYLYRLISASSLLSGIPRNSPVQVYFPDLRPAELHSHVEKLKCCISILFAFQRQSLKDKHFVSDSRRWLTKLVAFLLRVGTFEDHLFVLNHVLRCPAGIASWATSYIQIPIPTAATGPYPVGGPFLDHVMTIMATLLLPIRAREEFLQNLNLESSVTASVEDSDNKWVLVDSEGEEDEDPKNCWLHLRENDLVSVLNQIPIGALFRHLLGVFSINDVDYYDNRYMTDQEMMRVFSVATQLVRLFRESFRTYNLSRYKQFTKRVSQFIRHLVINVTDHLQAFLNLYPDLPPFTRQRLLAEYDQFFLRSTYSIFSSQRRGAWQFMAAMPYTTVSVEMLWKILWLLHNDYEEDLESVEEELSASGWQKKLSDQHLHLKFEERLSSLPENEAYYLLTAFANMATSRNAQDRSLIETICGEVFQISFVNETSKEMCFKWGRELLSGLGAKHQFIMSVLTQEVSVNIEKLGKAAMYLFQELPCYLWQPVEEDIVILTKWLKEFPPSAIENQLAQMILSQLNWSFNDALNQLWLDISLHRRILLTVWESYQTHMSSVKGGAIYESIKQITSIAAALKSGFSPDEVFRSWAWKMLRTLKVHVNEIPISVAKTIANLLPVPDLHHDSAFQSLRWSSRDKHPFSIVVAFKLTNIGHGIAEITQNMDYLQYLMDQQCFEGVIDLLYLITPLYFNCGHYLWTNRVFVGVIQNLLICDLTYLKMAKNMVISTFPGKYLQIFASMIEWQLQMREKMCWSVDVIVGFWIETFTTLPSWHKNEAVLYLLDSIFMSTFMENKEICLAILGKKFQQLMEKSAAKNDMSQQSATPSLSSFFSWLTTGTGIPFTFVQKDMQQKYPWLTYALLEMETQTERMAKLWKYVVKEFVANPASLPELALRKAAGAEDVMVPPAHHLPIYRWGLAAVELKDDCPIMPLFWQKFFAYYLQRPTVQQGSIDLGGIGQRFFSDMNDLFVLKKLKQKLQKLVAHHDKLKSTFASKTESESAEDSELNVENKEWEINRSKELFHDNLLRLYRAMSLWLEESQLHEANLYLPSLMADYDPQRLSLIIFQNSKEPWNEFLNVDDISEGFKCLVKQWSERSFRRSDWKRAVSKSDPLNIYSATGVEVILKRLRSYEEPTPPPLVATLKPVVPQVPDKLFQSGKAAREGLTTYFSVLTDFAKIFSNRLANHAALDCGYLELLPQIYQNVETEVQLSVACHKGQSTFNLSSDSGCLGPANIKLKFFEMKEISSAKNSLDQNRAEWLASINESLLGPPQNLCSSAVFIETTISHLLSNYKSQIDSGDISNSNKLREVGLNIFYQLCSIMDSDSELYPPTRQFMTSCMDILGKELIRNKGDQCLHLMQMILDCPRLISLLSPHFCPSLSGIETFIKLYRHVVSIQKTESANLVCIILSKFDVKSWLNINKPRVTERTELFQLIELGLTELGADIEGEFQMIAELYYQQLTTLLRHQFPDMYRDVLQFLFKGLAKENLCVSVWYHILNSLIFNDIASENLTDNTLNAKTTEDHIYVICSAFADNQDLFTQNQVQETLEAFGSRLMEIRTSSKELLFQTLYTKCARYVKPVTIFLSLMAHCYVGIVKRESVGGAIAPGVIRSMWNSIQHAFAPWILPINKNSETWYPWNIGHEMVADDVMTVFVNIVAHAVTNLYASINMLSLVLKMYSDVFAKPNVKEYILNPCHRTLSNLPWNTFWPDVSSVDLMIQILNQGVDDCLDFLGLIFLRISWPEVVHHIAQSSHSGSTLSKVVGDLLHLHIRLGLRPTLMQDEAMPRMLIAAATYPWHVLDAEVYENVLQCFKRDCDPKCVLNDNKDVALLNLLQMAGEFVPGAQPLYPEVIRKRKFYVNLTIVLLCKCATNSKDLNSRSECYKDVITDLLSHSEAVMATSLQKEIIFDESVAIVIEILNVFNLTPVKRLQDIAFKAVHDWSRAHPKSLILRSILFASTRCIVLPSLMAGIIESVLGAYFSIELDGDSNLHWPHMETVMKVPQLVQDALIKECLASEMFLTLNALAGLLLTSSASVEEQWKILKEIVEWLNQVKLMEEYEYKIILLWWRVLNGVSRSVGVIDATSISNLLASLSLSITIIGEDKSSQGLLSYIGLGRKSSLSLSMRFLARSVNAFVLKQACNFEFKGDNSAGKLHKSDLKKQAETAEEILLATTANKQYESFKPLFEHVRKFVCDSSVPFNDYDRLFGSLVPNLFPERQCLKFLQVKD